MSARTVLMLCRPEMFQTSLSVRRSDDVTMTSSFTSVRACAERSLADVWRVALPAPHFRPISTSGWREAGSPTSTERSPVAETEDRLVEADAGWLMLRVSLVSRRWYDGGGRTAVTCRCSSREMMWLTRPLVSSLLYNRHR